ncbi:CAMK/CAMKL/CHK1 protein kinase [Cyathus striatus]|nr:CAMK/CAMKL/CHK1 protein kinase [Cyathus striatus]
MSKRYPKVVGYALVEVIGGGGFSTVFRAVNTEEHRIAACKHILMTENTTIKERKTVEKEMRIHATLRHEYILEFINGVVVEVKHKHIYEPGFYMLMELAAGGDLFDKIAPDVGVGEEVAQHYFNQLIAGMDYIHKQGVCHRDLKPENLLLDAAGTLKISDFGLSSVFKLGEKTRLLSEKCGSLPYVAPELNKDEPYAAEPVDVWGMGVILFTLIAGNTPWDEPTIHSPEFCHYVSGSIFYDDPWNRISETALSLICGMLTVDPSERMTLAEVFQHPWCLSPSQLANQPRTLADKLTASLRANGDLGLAAPDLSQNSEKDDDGDTIMRSATRGSQFTQTLMLFSQTQSGTRYTPHLTRFYASLGPTLLISLIKETLELMGVSTKGPEEDGQKMRLRIGGWDARRVQFKGWVWVERFSYRDVEGSFCVFARDVGNPISWRKIWKSVILSPIVEPHVLRKTPAQQQEEKREREEPEE